MCLSLTARQLKSTCRGIRWPAAEVYLYLHSNIDVSERIFLKLANDFYLNIYHLAAYLQLSVENLF